MPFGKAMWIVALLLVAVVAAQAEPAARPNVVVILADDLGYGDVQCLNPERGKIRTPHLDRFAAEGMRFTDAHAGASVCTPTRYGLLTGRYAWRTRLQRGVLDNYVEPLIAADRLTLPGLLGQHGYHSMCVGKWHLGFRVDRAATKSSETKLAGAPLGALTRDGPITRGFDAFYGFHHARMMKSVFVNDRVDEIVEPVDMLPHLVHRAEAYIEQRALAGKPFFLYLALNSPHTPIVPAAAWKGRSGLGDYADFVMATDGAVGDVLSALERAGVAERTLVVFTSDNGCSPAASTGNLEKNGHFASGPFRGYKADIWDGGHRVPFLVRWPSVVQAGTSSSQLVCLTDLMATAAELVGATLPEDAAPDSFSILPLLRGLDRPVRPSVVHHSIDGFFALREPEWKLALCAGSGGWEQPKEAVARKQGLPDRQLYNLVADPGEQHNRCGAHPEIAERLTRQLETIVQEGRSTPGPRQQNDVPVRLDRSARTAR